MSVNRWWQRGEGEIYWLATTDRSDLGANLKAPKYDDANRDNWRYTLLREMQPGDVVFHYSNTRRAIVGRSVVSAKAKEHEIPSVSP